MTLALPKPVRTFNDPVTGVTMHQLTDGPEPSVHLYFTHRSWIADGKYLLLLRRVNSAWNYFVVGPDGAMRQLTHYPPTLHARPYMKHMHRAFFSEEIERMMFRMPAIHPTLPLIVFAWDNALHLLDVETGRDELIHRFPEAESQQPKTLLHTEFTADGKHIILVTNREAGPDEPRIDPPEQEWNFGLRDESRIVSTVWRYDFEQRRLDGVIFRSNGEQVHPLCCPWDADLILWTHYLHCCFYTVHRDGTQVRKVLTQPNHHMGHYNWDVANRRLMVIDTDWGTRTTRLGTLDVERDEVRWFKCVSAGANQWHQNASLDGKWIVMDQLGFPIGDANGLSMVDQQRDVQLPLCQLRCSWSTGLKDDDGQPIKSESLHPNPSWSPDGRCVIVDSDFGTGVSQVYLVDTETWQG